MDSSIQNSSAYRAARNQVAVRRRDERGTLRVTGADRIGWLNGLLTNDIKALEGGGACAAAWLTPQGRMIADPFVMETGELTLLDVPGPLAADLAGRLDGLIFTEDVRVEDVSADVLSIELVGPESRPVWETVQQSAAAPLALRDVDRPRPGIVVYILRAHLAGTLEALAHAGATPLDDATAEVLRVEAGVPRFSVDIGEDTIPLEAGLDHVLSHTKGCYVGQEIIVRIRDRAHGRVARHLVGLRPESDAVPAAGQPVLVDGRQVGTLTSAVHSHALGAPIALATVHRDAARPGTRVSLADGTTAVVTALPFG